MVRVMGLIALALFGLSLLGRWDTPRQPRAETRPDTFCPTSEDNHQALNRLVEKQVALAAGEVGEAARRAVEPVADLFRKARGNTRAFADDSMSLYGKYCALMDLVPWTSKARLKDHLAASFAGHFFKPEDLAKAIETAAERFGGELESIESRLIVRLRADMESLPPAARPDAVTITRLGDRLKAEMEKARVKALGANAEHGAVLAGGMVASSVAGPVLVAAMESAIAAVLARTAGPAAAATTGTSLGGPLGFVAFLAVEMLVEWVWDWWTDPRGRLASQMDERLKAMEQAITEGDDKGPGMRQTLEKAGKARLDLLLQHLKSVVLTH